MHATVKEADCALQQPAGVSQSQQQGLSEQAPAGCKSGG